MFKKRETSSLENNPMSGDWLFCKEPPEDPSVTCFLADDVDWLDGKAPEGSPWLCSDHPAMRESPHDGSAAWPKVTTWSLPRSIDHGGLGEPELSGSLRGERSRQRPTRSPTVLHPALAPPEYRPGRPDPREEAVAAAPWLWRLATLAHLRRLGPYSE